MIVLLISQYGFEQVNTSNQNIILTIVLTIVFMFFLISLIRKLFYKKIK